MTTITEDLDAVQDALNRSLMLWKENEYSRTAEATEDALSALARVREKMEQPTDALNPRAGAEPSTAMSAEVQGGSVGRTGGSIPPTGAINQPTDAARREALELLDKVQGLYTLEKAVAHNKSFDDVDPCDALFAPIRAALLAPEVPIGWQVYHRHNHGHTKVYEYQDVAEREAKATGGTVRPLYAAPHLASQTGIKNTSPGLSMEAQTGSMNEHAGLDDDQGRRE